MDRPSCCLSIQRTTGAARLHALQLVAIRSCPSVETAARGRSGVGLFNRHPSIAGSHEEVAERTGCCITERHQTSLRSENCIRREGRKTRASYHHIDLGFSDVRPGAGKFTVTRVFVSQYVGTDSDGAVIRDDHGRRGAVCQAGYRGRASGGWGIDRHGGATDVTSRVLRVARR